MKPKIYLETTVISYLTAWRSQMLVAAANQEITRNWWELHGMDYLLTWNCKHIANAFLRQRIETICDNFGYQTPVICTPYEFLEF